MAFLVNLNADMGEGIGDDAGMLAIVKSASIACGFHAGDPAIMHRVATMAKDKGVSIGAHPSFHDLENFGRCEMRMAPDEIEYLVAYQLGALQAVAAQASIKVTHLKPHGALYNMAAIDRDYAMAIGRAVKAADPSLIYVVLSGSQMERAGRELGLATAREGFCDRHYEDDGTLTPRSHPDAMIKDPAEAIRQVVNMVTTGEFRARSGKMIKATIDTLCLHGDEPTAIEMAKQVRAGLEAAGVSIVPLTEMKLR